MCAFRYASFVQYSSSNTNNISINPHCFNCLFPLATKSFGILTLTEHDIHLLVGSSYLD